MLIYMQLIRLYEVFHIEFSPIQNYLFSRSAIERGRERAFHFVAIENAGLRKMKGFIFFPDTGVETKIGTENPIYWNMNLSSLRRMHAFQQPKQNGKSFPEHKPKSGKINSKLRCFRLHKMREMQWRDGTVNRVVVQQIYFTFTHSFLSLCLSLPLPLPLLFVSSYATTSNHIMWANHLAVCCLNGVRKIEGQNKWDWQVCKGEKK